MATCYRTNGRELRYQCGRGAVARGHPACQAITGRAVDQVVERLLLQALRPAAIEVSVALAEEVEITRTRERRQRALKLEQAAYEADRLERQYNRVEPENRLVTRTLEKRWEAALAERDRLAAEIAREDARSPVKLGQDDLTAIRTLADDIPALWRAPTTTDAERQTILRLTLERVVLFIENGSEKVRITCSWAGGRTTEHAFTRPVRWIDQLSRADELRGRVRALAEAGLRPPAIARALNVEGWLSASGEPFNDGKVRAMLARMGMPLRGVSPSAEVERRDDEVTVTELAARIDRPLGTLYAWVRRGWLPVRRVQASYREVFLVRLPDAEALVASRVAAACEPQRWNAPEPVTLTT